MHGDINTVEQLREFRKVLVRPSGTHRLFIHVAKFEKWLQGKPITGDEDGRVIPVTRVPEICEWPTLSALRWLIYKSSSPEALAKATAERQRKTPRKPYQRKTPPEPVVAA